MRLADSQITLETHCCCINIIVIMDAFLPNSHTYAAYRLESSFLISKTDCRVSLNSMTGVSNTAFSLLMISDLFFHSQHYLQWTP